MLLEEKEDGALGSTRKGQKKVISSRSYREKQGHKIQWENKETRWLVFLFFLFYFGMAFAGRSVKVSKSCGSPHP